MNKAEHLFTNCDADDLIFTFVFTLFMATITNRTFRKKGTLVTTSRDKHQILFPTAPSSR